MKEFVIDAKQENFEAVLDFVYRELASVDCPADTKTMIGVAVEEIFVNVAHYAYRQTGESGSVVIRVTVGDEVSIEFEDHGTPYNPLDKEAPDFNAPVESRKIGGLGIHMVKHFMDQVDYTYGDGTNKLTIKKALAVK